MEKSEDVLDAASDNNVVCVICLHNLILVLVEVEEAHHQIGSSVGFRIGHGWSGSYNSVFARLALRISNLNCSITVFCVASLNTVTSLVEDELVSDVLIPHSSVLIEIKG